MVVPTHRRILRTLRRSYKSHKRSAKETRRCCSGHTERPQQLGTSHAQGSRMLAKERRSPQVMGRTMRRCPERRNAAAPVTLNDPSVLTFHTLKEAERVAKEGAHEEKRPFQVEAVEYKRHNTRVKASWTSEIHALYKVSHASKG
ncbi:hypothetical protein SESBI_12732 [Sesbania bispinosa]|nr:hypothetical protein SESBI_12732 [Sesbania bispinosa]